MNGCKRNFPMLQMPGRVPAGTFRAERTGSPRRTGSFTEPIRCRNVQCKKVFYTEYVNGFSWKCPYCGTVH